jgi:hypothetical protein
MISCGSMPFAQTPRRGSQNACYCSWNGICNSKENPENQNHCFVSRRSRADAGNNKDPILYVLINCIDKFSAACTGLGTMINLVHSSSLETPFFLLVPKRNQQPQNGHEVFDFHIASSFAELSN